MAYDPTQSIASILAQFDIRLSTAEGVTPAPTPTPTPTPGASTFTASQLPDSNRIYQRDTETGGGQNKGRGVVPVALLAVTVTGPVYARTRSVTDGSVLQASYQAATLAATGAQTVNIANVDARLGWFFLDLSGDGTTWQNGTTPIGMGDLTGIAGQSLAVRFVRKEAADTGTLASLNITPDPNGRVFAAFTDGGTGNYNPATSAIAWEQVADGGNYDHPHAARFLQLMIASTGVNHGLVGFAAGNTTQSQWLAGTGNMTKLQDIFTRVGNKVRRMQWLQGHSDGTAGTTAATFKSNLTNIFGAFTTSLGSSYSRYVGSIPYLNDSGWGGQSGVTAIRQAAREWAAANNATYVHGATIALRDGTHQTGAAGVTFALDWWRAMRPSMGLAGSNQGPTIASIARAAGTITVTMNMPAGATALSQTGSYTLRSRLSDQGTFANQWTNPVLTISGTTLTFPDPYPQVALDLYLDVITNGGGNDGGANMIFDNHIEADETALGITVGRYVEPMVTPVTVAASTAVQDYPMVLAGTPAYAAGKFANGLSAGRGAASGVPFPPTHTIEFWMLMPAVPGGTVVLFGANGREWLGVNNAGNLVITYTSTSTTTAQVADNVPHHIRLVMAPGTYEIFVDGLSIRTGTHARTGGMSTAEARALNAAASPVSGVVVDEMALFRGTAPTGVPTAAYTGNEAGLIALWHFDGNGTDSAAA